MGRKKLEDNIKKKTISISLDLDVFTGLKELKIKNKSKLISWLLKEHFNMNEEKPILR